MKKQLLTIFAIAISKIVLAQTNDYSETIGAKTELIKEVKKDKNSLWSNAQLWASSLSTQFYKKIEIQDKENGTMIIKVENYLPSGINGMNEFSKIKLMMNLKIDLRDNKYRAIFSNFTSTVAANQNIDVNNLSSGQLTSMTIELERIVQLSTNDFKEEVIWSIDSILSAKDRYMKRISEINLSLNKVDIESKSGKKESIKMKNWIGQLNNKITYLDFILTGFGKTTDELKNSLNSSLAITDTF
ncbi:hypothetical protein A0256_23435 [Mucilaginibacter sp. PAMC 26640]|nr:hypothetical protein A0256_23435 [Mucilaginibacter sp. PAMC 26640]